MNKWEKLKEYIENDMILWSHDASKVLAKMEEIEAEALKPKMCNIPDYGTLMAYDEFRDSVESGCIMDDDGHGYYATCDQMSTVLVDIDDFDSEYEGQPDDRFTHVVWFNR